MNKEEQEAIDFFKDNALVRIENEQIVASGNAYKVVILNLIDRLQKENEELKSKKIQVRFARGGLADMYIIPNEYIHKDKIRDKIEELEEQCKTELLTTWLEAKIEVLEDLLEGE